MSKRILVMVMVLAMIMPFTIVVQAEGTVINVNGVEIEVDVELSDSNGTNFYPLADSVKDADMVMAAVDQTVDEILGKIITKDMNTEQKTKAVYDFLIYQYKHQGNADEVHGDVSKKIQYNIPQFTQRQLESVYFHIGSKYSVAKLLLTGEGVCDDFAYLFSFMLNELDIPSFVVGGDYINRDGSTASHAWNYVRIDNKWYWYDVDVEGSVYRRSGKLSYYLYKKDTQYWKTNHSWLEEEVDSTLFLFNPEIIKVRFNGKWMEEANARFSEDGTIMLSIQETVQPLLLYTKLDNSATLPNTSIDGVTYVTLDTFQKESGLNVNVMKEYGIVDIDNYKNE